MTRTFAFAAAAPLALALAACGGSDETAAPADDGMATTTSANTPTMQPDGTAYPQVALDARSTVDYQGSYELREPDGRTSTLTLGDNDSYTMRGADGTESQGTFNWYSDNSRILIRENGETQVYAVADGALYRMRDENQSVENAANPGNAYMRVGDPMVGSDGEMEEIPAG